MLSRKSELIDRNSSSTPSRCHIDINEIVLWILKSLLANPGRIDDDDMHDWRSILKVLNR